MSNGMGQLGDGSSAGGGLSAGQVLGADALRTMMASAGLILGPATLPAGDPDAPATEAWQRNIAVLRVLQPELAAALEATPARADVRFLDTDEGVPTALEGEPGRQLASRRRPLEEAKRLAETIDTKASAAMVVLGFGLGYHVRAIQERMKHSGAVIVFEPDLGLLRAVLERLDHSAWLSTGRVVVVSRTEIGAITSSLEGLEGMLAVGTTIVDHPPSRARLGGLAGVFCRNVTEVLKATRTSVLTTLVQVEITLRNLLMNVDRYATAPGVKDLENAAKGRPAVVVSAGPSLKRNLELLSRPGVRDRVVIIAVQTVLKTLLEHGIRPHFVTALDYHEISRRFYEGLTPADVRGVTLVAEAKANPAILDAFPGVIRCPQEKVLDQLLGGGIAGTRTGATEDGEISLVRDMGTLRSGATVAHLAYYLARHLGCDPVILIGQDLGFTDGQYYAAGAAIHSVWAQELSDFHTLETLEWQRIVRGRHLLHRTQDVLGRPIYTDEQMNTYRVQFERDFLADAEAGRTTIDATEGGVRKQHTQAMTLAQALETFAGERAPHIELPRPPAAMDSPLRRRAVIERVRAARNEVWQVAHFSREAERTLGRMAQARGDQALINKLIEEVYQVRDRVTSLREGYWLVQHLNQTGTLKRFRADRAIDLDDTLGDEDRQQRQIERDRMNVRWLADAAEQAGSMLDDAARCLAGAPKVTRDRVLEIDDQGARVTQLARKKIVAVIPVDPARSSLGTPRDLSEQVWHGKNALELTLERLSQCKHVSSAVLLARDEASVQRLTRRVSEQARKRLGLSVERSASALDGREPGVAGARIFARDGWRGGVGQLSIYDEVFSPQRTLEVLEREEADGALILGADWCLIDPELTDQLIERYLERPSRNQVTFAHTAAGLTPCFVETGVVREIANKSAGVSPLVTLGALLGYIPIAPQSDPIAKPACVQPDPAVRDVLRRAVADSASRREWIAAALETLGARAMTAPAIDVARALAQTLRERPELAPVEHLKVDLTGEAVRDLELIRAAFASLRTAQAEDLALTLTERVGTGFDHASWPALVREARSLGARAVHIRTALSGGEQIAEHVLESGAEVVSVDLAADQAETAHTLTGRRDFELVKGNVAALRLRVLSDERAAGGLPRTWLVPRITRRDEVYAEIEGFYDHWLMTVGACVIDPLAAPIEGARIAPLPAPDNVRRRNAQREARFGPAMLFTRGAAT
ncbi:MAG: 6-hydroxymethylpterin diphosphokinase MptE-like protein [Planctomycetota bacterium]|nr:6-hydroxymethylpterin diphosphokinase MptE-like protein [Planctomycetota bacterium]